MSLKLLETKHSSLPQNVFLEILTQFLDITALSLTINERLVPYHKVNNLLQKGVTFTLILRDIESWLEGYCILFA